MDAAEQVVAALDDRHLRAHAGEELRELGADRAAAHDDEAPRNLVRARRLAVRPVLDRVEPLDRRDRGPRAGRERRAGRTAAPRRRPRRRPAARRGPRRARAGSSTPGGSGAGRSRPSRSSSSRATTRRRPAPDARRASPGARSSDAAELGRPQHRLRRHAGEVRALAADEPALDERDLRLVVEPAEGADEMLAGRPSAEDDDLHYFSSPFALRNAVRDLLRRRLVARSTALFIALHRRQGQLRRDGVARLREQRPVRPFSSFCDTTGATFWKPKMCLCRPAPCTSSSQLLRVGREAVAAGHLALVEQRVDADRPERDELAPA